MVYLPSLDLFWSKLSDQHMLPPPPPPPPPFSTTLYFSMIGVPFANILAHIAPHICEVPTTSLPSI